ncbi:MAG: nucleotide 5'-monophosphate nucleosidase PpnN [SAR324 cluster bacterium]|nr:nucleotide 5'-monophosphate nucleosidase PpnN [SAR324 cluster bacterium]
MDASIRPKGILDFLSQQEIRQLSDPQNGGLNELFRRCALAVLNSDSHTDSGKEMLASFPNFSIEVVQQTRSIKLEIRNAPPKAFVDGKLIQGINEHLFSVLRDIVFVGTELSKKGGFDLNQSSSITDFVYHILRNTGLLRDLTDPNLVVCWGGHSIGEIEYQYTKKVGYQLGLREFNICTGCGAGAMKGPMKGATIAHAKQRYNNCRYIGITEPGIIASESPNPIVNTLVVMPDIEKRLEAFVRSGHAFIVFPGAVGTTEEILYLLGILMHPKNAEQPFPLVFTGPIESKDYFELIDSFICSTLGEEAREYYDIIIDNPQKVAKRIQAGIKKVREVRKKVGDAFYYNWMLHIEREYQRPFTPTHEAMSALNLHYDQPKHELACNLRKMFSGIVSGNIKEEGVLAIEKNGPFQISGDTQLMAKLDALLATFCHDKRMKLSRDIEYKPCYEIVA